MSTLTKQQTTALLAALNAGGALNTGASLKNGAALRMAKRLAAAGLLTTEAPYTITERGKQALRTAGHLKDQRTFRIKHGGEIWTLTTPAQFAGAPVTWPVAQDMLVQLAGRVLEVA